MTIVAEGIRVEEHDKLSFGNYEAIDKIKAKIELNGDEYGVKTHNEVTRLEKNGTLLCEAVPGAAILHFKMTEKTVSFFAAGTGDTQFTLELLPETEYKLNCDDVTLGKIKTNRSGKVNFSVELDDNEKRVKLEKCD